MAMRRIANVEMLKQSHLKSVYDVEKSLGDTKPAKNFDENQKTNVVL